MKDVASKDLIYKQSALKRASTTREAQLKGMLATFVDRLADFAATTGDYHDRIGACAERSATPPTSTSSRTY